MRAEVLAIDVGGTKLAAGLVDDEGSVRAVERAPTLPGADAEQLWSQLTDLLDRVLTTGADNRRADDADASGPDDPRAHLIGVGAGCGGPMRWPAGEVSPLNIPGWRDFPLRQRLTDRYAGVPVRVHNDAIALAIAEHWRGAGQGTSHLLGMVVSTGVGGGLVLGGRLIDGATGNAGHIGHVVVEPDGPRCGCGARGCLEAVARGPALTQWAHEHGWRTNGGGTGTDLAADARAGDPVAVAAYTRGGRAVGHAIAAVAAVCDLEVVAIGGGVSQAGDLLFGPLREALDGHAGLGFVRAVRVVPAALGQESGLIGAAALIHQGDSYWTAD